MENKYPTISYPELSQFGVKGPPRWASRSAWPSESILLVSAHYLRHWGLIKLSSVSSMDGDVLYQTRDGFSDGYFCPVLLKLMYFPDFCITTALVCDYNWVSDETLSLSSLSVCLLSSEPVDFRSDGGGCVPWWYQEIDAPLYCE